MRVLALASQKGGSGKTTLSGHLAVEAQRAGAGPVVLIDIDPQGSLADWWNERDTDFPAFAQTTVARLASEISLTANTDYCVSLLATGSIRNTQGGLINGKDVSAIALTGDIINERSITQEARSGRGFSQLTSVVDKAAGIEAE